jgi:hypothetical protein
LTKTHLELREAAAPPIIERRWTRTQTPPNSSAKADRLKIRTTMPQSFNGLLRRHLGLAAILLTSVNGLGVRLPDDGIRGDCIFLITIR